MALTLSICGATCLSIILSILFFPNITIKKIKISTYWVIAVIGAILLFAFSCVSLSQFGAELISNKAVNPLKILVIFISMTLMSVFLDSVGFFKYFANLALKKAGNSQFKLFVWLYIIVSVLTIFTSNDIIVLTFTPFICYFSKHAKINPVPYLITEFVAANTWSMFLIIGNPTNIYLATSLNIGFIEYTKVMFLPTIFSGIASFLVLYLIFNKSLKQKMPEDRIIEDVVITEKVSMIIGLAHLIACIILLVISSYVGLEMWYICLGFCLSLYISVFIYKLIKKEKIDKVTACFKQAPWELIPFVLSMFVIVLSLTNCGFTELVASLLGSENAIWTYGISSFFVANIINNIPMSVLYSSIVPYLSGSSLSAGIFASVIGSNVGAFLSPIGALAGIMFSSIMNNHGVKFTFIDFLKYGVVVAIPTLLASLLGLYLILLI
ncbi:MAG: hypothetical protein IJW26_05205 [Clostridia bacterium]|nr:hypothetical protein [Clostridia bacterium]